MSKASKSFVGGASVLAIAGLIGKIIGMFYRVWLTGLITTEGIALYGYPYSVYNFLLVISSAGLPTAISKMVSEQIAMGNMEGTHYILKKTRRILLCTGAVCTLVMALLAKPIAAEMGDAAAAPGFVALAPSIFFVCLLSSYRGYFQGMQNMTPTAISQLIETCGKVIFGYFFVKEFSGYGLVWGAVGAIIGVTLAELLALLFIVFRFVFHKASLPRTNGSTTVTIPDFYMKLFGIAIPVTIGASMMPIVNLVDASLVVNRLSSIGYAVEEARNAYGVLTGMVNTMVNMPAVVTLSFSMSLVPAISTAIAAKDRKGLQSTVSTGLKLALMFGSAAAVGMGILSKQILTMLYASQTAESLALGGKLLSVMSIGILFLSIVQTTTGMLQGLGKPGYPVKTLAVGVLFKIILNAVLIGIPSVNVMGAAYASVVCYGIAALGNVFMVLKLTKTRINVGDGLVRPVLTAVGMATVVWAFVKFCPLQLGNTMLTAAAVALGLLTYAVLVFVLRALNENDWMMIPGGRKVLRLLGRGKRT